ncbi:MAG TPA: PQQ-binding-like beta-propeller repeat protein [Candidatus Eisenbacteria bacterium]|nr:PQQ-binding-like beta-propeller repeat protein [Candidatus Eisenbacteria bacterium]
MRVRKSRAMQWFLLSTACAASLLACKSPSDSGAGSPANRAAISKSWELPLGSRGEGALALSDDGTIIAACQDGFVYAVDPRGVLQWKTYVGPTAASPAIGPDGAIYIANNNGAVYALNRAGSQRWQSIVYEGNTYGHNAAAVGTSFLFVPSRDGLKALNLSNGSLEWSAGVGTEQWGAVTLLADGTVLFGGHGRLNAVNTQGDIIWQYPPLTDEALQRNSGFPPPGDFFVVSGIAPGADHILYLGMGRNVFAAVGQDAALRWQLDTRGTTLNNASPVVASDGTIYFSHSDGHLYAYDKFGAKKWAFDMRGASQATPILASDGTLFAIGGRNLYALSPAGSLLAKVDVAEAISSPTLAPDGTIYVLNANGVLAAYAGGHGGLMNSAWPKFQGDLANSGNQSSR